MSQWIQKVQEEVAVAQKAVQHSEFKKDLREKAVAEAEAWEQFATDWIPKAQEDLKNAEEAKSLTEAALTSAIAARRKAWRASLQVKTSNMAIASYVAKTSQAAAKERLKVANEKQEAQQQVTAALEAVSTRKEKVAEAEALDAAAAASGDHVSMLTAKNGQLAAVSAFNAAESAAAAAETSNKQVASKSYDEHQIAEALDEKASQMGELDDLVANTAAAAEKCDELMAKAKSAHAFATQLVADATAHVEMRINTLREKEQDTSRTKRLLMLQETDLQRKRQQLEEIENSKTHWDAINHANDLIYQDLQNSTTVKADKLKKAETLLEEAASAAVKARQTADAALQTTEEKVPTRATIVRKGGLQKVALLMEMRQKQVEKLVQDAEEGLTVASLEYEPMPEMVQKKKDIMLKGKVVLAERKTQQDSSVAGTMSVLIGYKEAYRGKLMAEGNAQKDLWMQEQVLVNIEEIHRISQNRLAAAETQRRDTAMGALHSRVLRRWHTHAYERDPVRSRPIEEATFLKILGTWDRDGTPLGGSTHDKWYWEHYSSLFESYLGEDGFLNQTIVDRCSASCGNVREMCNIKKGARNPSACSRGLVSRVRFQLTKTLNATSDWWVCRCNGGVLQLAASEKQRWHRGKDRWVQATLSPDAINFDTRLQGHETVSDKYVHCFQEFPAWLHTKPSFSRATNLTGAETSPEMIDLHPSSNLDALALSPSTEVMTSYSSVKSLWRQQCLKQPMASSYPSDIEPGGDDSSIDIFPMHIAHTETVDLQTIPQYVDQAEYQNSGR
jgi:hypothetical protein